LTLFHFTCGRITTVWSEADLLAQLGLIEGDATPAAAGSAPAGTPVASNEGCPPPTEDEARTIAMAWSEVWNSHDVTQYDGLLSPEAVHHFGVRPDAVGLSAIQENLAGFFAAFPDLHGTVESIVIDGDRVAVRYTTTGTFTGPFFGVDPTGSPVSWTGMAILRISCGLVVESWGEIDGYTLWQQMGMLESLATPTA
jgi:predicted ester cyclase